MRGRAALVGLWVGLGLISGCVQPRVAAGRTTRSPTLERAVRDRMASDDAIAWSDDRRLTWADFQGQPPATGEEGALTAYSLFQGLRCNGSTFEFHVIAAMLPHRSWVKHEVLADPALNAHTLEHEQTHLNLTEVYARRMRKYFAALYDPCGQSEERLRASADRFVHDEAADQTRYDLATRHGLNAALQRNWTKDVQERLADLRAFSGE